MVSLLTVSVSSPSAARLVVSMGVAPFDSSPIRLDSEGAALRRLRGDAAVVLAASIVEMTGSLASSPVTAVRCRFAEAGDALSSGIFEGDAAD